MDEQTLEVDFEGTGRPYHAEWRRCGPRQAEWKPDRQTLDYPTHFVAVTRNAVAATPLVVFGNAGEPGLSYIQSVRGMQFTGDGRQQLAVVTGIYGTVEALIYDKNRDANCCPNLGSIFVELRPANGRFVLGNVWRLAPGEDSR